MDKITKVFNCEVKQIGEDAARTLEFVGSTEARDHDGDELLSSGWDLSIYNKNPIVMGFHQYDKFPYANSQKTYVDPKRKALIFEVHFPTIEELTSYPDKPDMIAGHAKNVDLAYNMYKNSYMRAVSVGFIGNESEPIQEGGKYMGRRYKSQTLLELSLVPVPANSECLTSARAKGFLTDDDLKIFKEKELNQLQSKMAMPYKKHPLADEGAAWDGPAEMAAAEVADLKEMCAWYDEENADVKQSYKLPHHTQADKNTVWRGVSAAMGALLGSRGGIDIPEDDKQGVHKHLAAHYADFDKTAPEFKDYTEIEIKEMFPEEVKAIPVVETKKADLEGNPSVHDIFEALWYAINPAEIYTRGGPYVEDLYPIRYPSGNVIIEKMDKYYLYQYEFKDGIATLTGEGVELDEVYVPKAYKHKSGATLSTKNRELLNSIHDGIDKSRQELKVFIDGTMPMDPVMTAQMTVNMPMMEPTMSAQMTALASTPDVIGTIDGLNVKVEMSEEFKQALDELRSQVLILCQKTEEQEPPVIHKVDATKGEFDLDAIELPQTEKDPDKIELNIEPGELKTIIEEAVKKLIQGGN